MGKKVVKRVRQTQNCKIRQNVERGEKERRKINYGTKIGSQFFIGVPPPGVDVFDDCRDACAASLEATASIGVALAELGWGTASAEITGLNSCTPTRKLE